MYFPNAPSIKNGFLTHHAHLLSRSFQRLLKMPLLKTKADLAEQLFYAPFVLLSHNTNQDPIFNYANQQALDLFELDWGKLITLPSRYSAETLHQSERDKLIAQVNAEGFIENYQGVRISSTGKRFKIKKAIVWNLYDDDAIYYGQAACFSQWNFLE